MIATTMSFAARDEQPVTIPLSDLAEGHPLRQR